MSVAAPPLFAFDNTFARELPELGEPWRGRTVERPVAVVINGGLAEELGIDPAALGTPEAAAILSGSTISEGSEPFAMAYAGHQFGGYSPRLGDGRALLLGEVIDGRGIRQDLHLKGSGRTPFARGGDGRAAVGPMLREFAISEAMHALGIPTTRSLAVIATNDVVSREVPLPGAVLARVAESHLRVGTFEYAAALRDPALLRRLADYAIARHYPEAAEADSPYLAFFARVVAGQAELVARWMLVGFVHGVMNTDNMAISGQTIDYGPCAFMDRFDEGTVFSSIDHRGRYAYGNQPAIAQWNLARLGESLLPLLGDDQAAAIPKLEAALHAFVPQYRSLLTLGMATKLGLRASAQDSGDVELLVDELLALLQRHQPDYTGFMRALSASLRGDDAPLAAVVTDVEAFASWLARWRELLPAEGVALADAADAMDRLNPVYIPRNHLVEDALAAATGGDLAPFRAMLDVLREPFAERPGLEAWAAPTAEPDPGYQTFCGT
ncbi:MAG: YdiU family protein [Solirubrobacteraceae bacterium]|nr:YdiU family protein [Solirubrobacteraceae bacterium]